MVRRGEDFDRILDHPPLIAIEILSPKDRWRAMEEKSAQYLGFGIENIWVIDPAERIVYRFESGKLLPVGGNELTVPGTPIRVVLSEMFAELDR